MKAFFSSVSLAVLCGSVVWLAGCEVKDCKTEEGKDAVCAESLEEYKGDEQTLTQDYTDGARVHVVGLYGDILVQVGSPGEVSAKFSPFNLRSHKEEAEATRELEENLFLAVETDDEGNVTVSVDRQDATNGLGSHIVVSLPPDFNGPLVVENAGDGAIDQGFIDVSFVGASTSLDVLNNGLENCNILRGDDDDAAEVTALTDVSVECDADITVRGVNDNVIVHSNADGFHSKVRVEFGSISSSATGGRISGDDSTIEVLFPEGADFDVSAVAGQGASVAALDLPASCEATEDEARSKQLTCGSGGPPLYEISTQDDANDDESSFIRVLVQ